MEVKTRLSSKKKKNGTKSGGAANKSAKPTAEKIKETEKKAPEVIDEKDIPVQSLSEMLAFAQEAEEMQDAPEQETPKPVEIKIEAPKQEKPKPVEEKKEAPKQEEEPVDFSALSEHQTNIENKIDQYQQRLNGIMEEIRKYVT